MVTAQELEQWVAGEGIATIRIDDTLYFDSSNPWEWELDLSNCTAYMLARDGKIAVEWSVDGYCEEKFNTLTGFVRRWNRVMNHGLR